jgi:hypothetical protein
MAAATAGARLAETVYLAAIVNPVAIEAEILHTLHLYYLSVVALVWV